jgi:hypothetical protein
LNLRARRGEPRMIQLPGMCNMHNQKPDMNPFQKLL